jgi:glyoxylase-like metal-dependent hydrolase (beta-lactamase superfamily II)
MTHEARTVGSTEVLSIVDADLELDPIADAFPDIPPVSLRSVDADAASVRTDAGNWRLRVRAWLVRHRSGLVLVDTGVGGPTSPTAAWVPSSGVLVDALRHLGVGSTDIATVVITHVHDDHIGGLLDETGAPAFANARHVIQRADLDWQRALGRENDEERAIWELLVPLESGGMLDAMDGDHVLADGITLQHLPGHTPGHQIVHVSDGALRLTISADTWNHPLQLMHPEWPSGPDNDHAGAAEARRALRRAIAAEPGTIVAPTHFAEAFVTIDERADAAAWRPA